MLVQENILKATPHVNKKNSDRLLNVSSRILHSKQRILQSLMPNEHPGVAKLPTLQLYSYCLKKSRG